MHVKIKRLNEKYGYCFCTGTARMPVVLKLRFWTLNCSLSWKVLILSERFKNHYGPLICCEILSLLIPKKSWEYVKSLHPIVRML
jgi:hypothetical protein